MPVQVCTTTQQQLDLCQSVYSVDILFNAIIDPFLQTETEALGGKDR